MRRILEGRGRWLLLVAALLMVALMLGLALSQALRDTTPPQVYLVVPERVAAGEPFEVTLSASEPVVYDVTYGTTVLQQVTQDLTLDLIGRPGPQTLQVIATDGATNASSYSRTVTGVPAPSLTVKAPQELIPGEPYSFEAAWTPEGTTLQSVVLTKDGAPLPTFRQSNRVLALGSVPLGSPPGTVELSAVITDEFGRHITESRTLMILPDPQPIEQLVIAPSVLASSTPANKQLEARVLSAAVTSSPYKNAPLWRQPFLLPIEGHGTSAFASPRRYAPGGPVSYHQGADIGAPMGTPIHATNDGVVVIAGQYPIKGGLVVIDHGANVFSLYFHQSKILVEVGDKVTRGQVIGEVGSTGLATGPHLHWEMRLGLEPTNPVSWVGTLWP
ncbi:MAG TPA: M23 family metallopeptidase [Trueperaceae bacterium]